MAAPDPLPADAVNRAPRRRLLTAVPLMALTSTVCSNAAPLPEAAQVGAPVTMPGASYFDMRSQAGLDYRLFVAEPALPPPAGGRPVLLFPDGNAYFGAAAALVTAWSALLPRMATFPIEPNGRPFEPQHLPLVVGIGFPGAPPTLEYVERRRTFDLAPKRSGLKAAVQNLLGNLPTGGADAFLGFVLDALLPSLARRYPIDTGRVTLAGHSLGGLFALHAMLRRPQAFQAIAAISPSIWVNAKDLLAGIDALVRQDSPSVPQQVLLAVAQDEIPMHQGRSTTMLESTRAMHNRLQSLRPHGMQAQLLELERDDHLSTFFSMLPTIVRLAGMPAMSAQTSGSRSPGQ